VIGWRALGHLNCSRWTGFESPDPLYWVGQRYVVVQADVRGMHDSEGFAGVLRDQDATDYAEIANFLGILEFATHRWPSG
jgi:predicted acyl esterase